MNRGGHLAVTGSELFIRLWTDIQGVSVELLAFAVLAIAILWGVTTGIWSGAFGIRTQVEQHLVTASTPFLTGAFFRGVGLIVGLSLALVLTLVAALLVSWIGSATICQV